MSPNSQFFVLWFLLEAPILQADKRLRLLAFLQNTLRSAADRINRSNFRGRCGTVNYHTLLNVFFNDRLSVVTNDRPHLPLSHGIGF